LAIEKNLQKAKVSGRVRQSDVFQFLKNVGTSGDKFHIIFADPPYEKMKSGEGFTEKLLGDEVLPQLLGEGGVFVLEKRPGENVPGTGLWNLLRQKTYGATEVLFLTAINADRSQTNLVRRSLGEGGSAIS
jgi:16S rRNA G966 N2-methylase RsmD